MNERRWSDSSGCKLDEYGDSGDDDSSSGCGQRHRRPAMTSDDYCGTRIVVDEHEPEIGTPAFTHLLRRLASLPLTNRLLHSELSFIFGPRNGSPDATNVVFVGFFAAIRFSKY